ncbi:MAG: EAL domain-containing protein [Pseudomonadota bacterium]
MVILHEMRSRVHRMVGSFRAPVVEGELASVIRAKQIETVRGLIPTMMMAQLINGAVVLMAFWRSGAEQLLGLWAITLCFLCGTTMLRAVRSQETGPKKTRSLRSIERMTRGAMLMGFVWGVVPVIVIPYTGTLGHMTLGIILAGMSFAGAFLMARVPSAAYALIVPIMIGQIIGMQLQPDPVYDLLSILSVIYVGMLVVCIQWSHSRYVDQLVNEAAIIEQEQLISLLLRDFEESTSDWLWQIDDEGSLVEIPTNVRGDKDQYAMMSAGKRLVDVFSDSDARNILEKSIERRQSFRDLVLPVDTPNGESWWLLTGKPIFNAGFFAGFRGVASDVTSSKESEDRIAHLAHYDTLTGLPNRVTLLEALERHVRTKPAPGHQKALFWVDLDNFKWVNDTLGHPAGDELLRMVADRLSAACEGNDIVARLGGDEFAMILERKGSSLEIELAAHEIVNEFANPFVIMGSSVRCTASIGVRKFDPFTYDAQTLLKHADLALYEVKTNGRAGVCVFTSELEVKASKRRQIENDLSSALDNNELLVYFQPQIDAKSRQMIGCEALLRWAHPTKGLIFPSEFIECAEDSGIITRLGDWVIRAALEQAKRLPEHVRIAVNISPLQIHSANLFSTIVNALARNELDPARLDLEITESVLMNDTEFTLDRLHQLKQLGVRISLDDFGTGFSSLSYLRKFPFDKIKIDKSFVSDLEISEDSRAITVATLGLAKSLGLRCTAEGVETEFQSRFLTEHGCDELQGFFISRAHPIELLSHFVDIAPLDPGTLDPDRRNPLTLVSFNGETVNSADKESKASSQSGK